MFIIFYLNLYIIYIIVMGIGDWAHAQVPVQAHQTDKRTQCARLDRFIRDSRSQEPAQILG